MNQLTEEQLLKIKEVIGCDGFVVAYCSKTIEGIEVTAGYLNCGATLLDYAINKDSHIYKDIFREQQKLGRKK